MDKTRNNIRGFIKISDVTNANNPEIIVQKENAIHYENFSQALANSVTNRTTGYIEEMHFGNGGTAVDSTGVITYLTPNNTGSNSSLYNQTYYKSINDLSSLNNDTARNKIVVRHTTGNKYTDIIVTALLDYGEPSGEAGFDNTTTMSDTFVFDEFVIVFSPPKSIKIQPQSH